MSSQDSIPDGVSFSSTLLPRTSLERIKAVFSATFLGSTFPIFVAGFFDPPNPGFLDSESCRVRNAECSNESGKFELLSSSMAAERGALDLRSGVLDNPRCPEVSSEFLSFTGLRKRFADIWSMSCIA